MALWGRMSLPPSLPAPRSHGKLRRSLKGTGVGSDVRFVADLRWKPAKYGTHTRPAYTHSLTYFRGSRVSGNSAAGWGWDCTGRRTDVSRSPDRRTQYHATRARPSLTAHHRQQSTRTPLTRTERLVRGLAEATRSPARTWCGLTEITETTVKSRITVVARLACSLRLAHVRRTRALYCKKLFAWHGATSQTSAALGEKDTQEDTLLILAVSASPRARLVRRRNSCRLVPSTRAPGCLRLCCRSQLLRPHDRSSSPPCSRLGRGTLRLPLRRHRSSLPPDMSSRTLLRRMH